MDPELWRGRRVLVTGHTGFKGSWLALWLARLGARTCGLALEPPTVPSLFEAARVADGMTSIHGDVRDLAIVSRAIADHAPEVVFHLAAQSLVRESYARPVDTYATNVLGTVHVLEACRGSSVRAIVVVTTDKCYENREWAWGYREIDPMGGHDPYSSSKGCAELVTSAYRRSFFEGARVASARAGNVIGGGDFARDRLVPDAARAFAAGETLVVRNPASIRPWQHVLDPLHGYLLLAERLLADPARYADAWNFGPSDDGWRVSDVADAFTEAWGDGRRWEARPDGGQHEARTLRLDCSKARADLGWTPRLDARAAVEWTARFYKEHAAGAPARELALRDLAAYEERLAS